MRSEYDIRLFLICLTQMLILACDAHDEDEKLSLGGNIKSNQKQNLH